MPQNLYDSHSPSDSLSASFPVPILQHLVETGLPGQEYHLYVCMEGETHQT